MRALVLALAVALAAPPVASALTTFSSPSKNIGCVMDPSDGVRCDIRSRTWSAPPKPRTCDVDFGQGIGLGRRAGFVCAGDTVLGAKRILAYSRTLRVGHFTCTSRATGMTCTNHLTRHGFTLARTRYRIF